MDIKRYIIILALVCLFFLPGCLMQQEESLENSNTQNKGGEENNVDINVDIERLNITIELPYIQEDTHTTTIPPMPNDNSQGDIINNGNVPIITNECKEDGGQNECIQILGTEEELDSKLKEITENEIISKEIINTNNNNNEQQQQHINEEEKESKENQPIHQEEVEEKEEVKDREEPKQPIHNQGDKSIQTIPPIPPIQPHQPPPKVIDTITSFTEEVLGKLHEIGEEQLHSHVTPDSTDNKQEVNNQIPSSIINQTLESIISNINSNQELEQSQENPVETNPSSSTCIDDCSINENNNESHDQHIYVNNQQHHQQQHQQQYSDSDSDDKIINQNNNQNNDNNYHLTTEYKPIQNTTPNITKKPMTPDDLVDKFNYASAECGATVLATNKEAREVSSILHSSKDRYLLNECDSDQWVVIELCEEIGVQIIEMANYEFFSSMFKDFIVMGISNYPGTNWHFLGNFTANNVRKPQFFALKEKSWYKYLKVKMLTHYGDQMYCPISDIKVYGTTFIDDLKDQERINKKELEDINTVLNTFDQHNLNTKPQTNNQHSTYSTGGGSSSTSNKPSSSYSWANLKKFGKDLNNNQDLDNYMVNQNQYRHPRSEEEENQNGENEDTMDIENSGASGNQPTPITTNTPPTNTLNNNPQSGNQPQSIFKSLANRLKSVEINQSISYRYLERLETKYSDLIQSMKDDFNKMSSIFDQIAHLGYNLEQRVERERVEIERKVAFEFGKELNSLRERLYRIEQKHEDDKNYYLVLLMSSFVLSFFLSYLISKSNYFMYESGSWVNSSSQMNTSQQPQQQQQNYHSMNEKKSRRNSLPFNLKQQQSIPIPQQQQQQLQQDQQQHHQQNTPLNPNVNNNQSKSLSSVPLDLISTFLGSPPIVSNQYISQQYATSNNNNSNTTNNLNTNNGAVIPNSLLGSNQNTNIEIVSNSSLPPIHQSNNSNNNYKASSFKKKSKKKSN